MCISSEQSNVSETPKQECLGVGDMAAMAVISQCSTWRRSRTVRRRLSVKQSRDHLLGLQMRAAKGGGSHSCVEDVKEDFVDEEDYKKAGGSEILFVQMQRTKEADKQAKVADTDVERFSWLFIIFCRPCIVLLLYVHFGPKQLESVPREASTF